MLTSGVVAMVGSAVLLLNDAHAWREALHLAAACKRMDCMGKGGRKYKSSMSPSDGGSDCKFPLAWCVSLACGEEDMRLTFGSTVDCVI